MADPTPPPITRILETILYVKHMPTARDFYTSIFNLTPMLSTDTITAFPLDAARSHVLLLFQLGATTQEQRDGKREGNLIPAHGPTENLLPYLLGEGNVGESGSRESGSRESLRQHFCFAVDSAEDVRAWERHLKAKGVEVCGRMDWGSRGYSIYFWDLEGNPGEVASGRLWQLYGS